MRRRRAVLLAATVLIACELAVEPTADRRVVGIIVWQPAPSGATTAGIVLAAPDTVHAGRPFTATITTVGLSGCWSADGADVAYDSTAASARVTPYDLVMTKIDGAPTACTGALVDLPRAVSLVFPRPGLALLRVHGRKVTGGELGNATPASVEQQILVR